MPDQRVCAVCGDRIHYSRVFGAWYHDVINANATTGRLECSPGPERVATPKLTEVEKARL